MKKICCICSKTTTQAIDFFATVRKYTKIDIVLLSPLDSVAEFDVVVFMLSEDLSSNAMICKQLKEASNLNKIFLPIILGGNWWKTWNLKRSYKGPDLRSPFLELRKETQMLELLQQVAYYGGSKICGDIYGSEVEFNVDLDCKVFRNNELIAELKDSHKLKITLYKGMHKIVFQSIKHPELIEIVSVKVKKITSVIQKDVQLYKHRYVKKRVLAGGYYEGVLLLNVRDGKGKFWYSNGDVYDGFWKNGVISGKGLMKYSTGETYEGDWYNGVYHGVGTKSYSDGSKYVGNWRNGHQHGHGIIYNAKGEEVIEGEWMCGHVLPKQSEFKK